MSNRRRKETLVSKIFEVVDMFNGTAHLMLKRRRVVPTLLGGLLSIALIFFILSQISAEFAEMFNYEGAQIYEINERQDDPAIVKLYRDSNFFLAIAVVEDSKTLNFTEFSPFNFKTSLVKQTRLPNGAKRKESYPLLWAACNETDFPEEIYGYSAFSQMGLNYAFCATGINYTNSNDGSCPGDIEKEYPDCICPPDFDIKGNYNSEELYFIQCNLHICEPDDPNLPFGMICNPTNINSKLLTKQYKLNLYYSYSLINAGDHKTPNKTLIENVYWNVNPKIYKVADLFVDEVTVQDFDDFMFETAYHNYTFYSAPGDKMRELETMKIQAVTSPATSLMQWNMRRSTINRVTSRTYQKITGVLADIGGFSQALLFICAAIAIGYVRYKYRMLVSNELYDFRFEDMPPKIKPAAPGKIQKKKTGPRHLLLNLDNSQNVSHNNSSHMIVLSQDTPTSFKSSFLPDKVICDYADKLKSKRKLKGNEFQFVRTIFYMMCCKRNPEEELAKKARKAAVKELDIVRIMRKLQEFDRLKVTLLNTHQRKAFDFIEKPLVTLESKKPLHSNSLTISLKSVIKKKSGVSLTRDLTMVEESQLKQEFSKGNEDFNSLMNYGTLYVAYRNLSNDHDLDNEHFNRKLLMMLNPDLLKVFKRVDQLVEYDDPDAEHFKEIVKTILETNGKFVLK